MKVRMKVTVAGTIQGQRTVEGETIDVPDGAGAQLCDQGLAEPVGTKPSARRETRDLSSYHTGGGWYEIDGEKYRGEDAAREALENR